MALTRDSFIVKCPGKDYGTGPEDSTVGKCGKQMKPLFSVARPEKSEWYCESCHKAEPMDLEVARAYGESEKEMHREARGGK